MNPETLFSICNSAVLPGWLLLVFLPRWKWSAGFVSSVLLPGALGLVYLYLAAMYFFRDEGGFTSLAGVASLFSNPHVLLAGWIHYLAFDLFIGAWEVRDSQRSGVRHVLVVPCLLLTFMLGPIGLVAYLTIRAIVTGRLALNGDGASIAPSQAA
jgi:hypothetical protein